MASMRIIKNRIRSVKSTEQIIKAMNLVAASKLQRARMRLITSRPFSKEFRDAMADIVNDCANSKHPYVAERPVENTLIVLITGDRGLCGGYNANVSREAFELCKGDFKGALVVIGNKGRDYFTRRKKTILKTYTGISETPFMTDAAEIGAQIMDLYNSGAYDKVYLVYTEFKSTLSYKPQAIQLLPVEQDPERVTTVKMNYEPDELDALESIVPNYVNTMIFSALMESSVCQIASRMMSMDSASDNAQKIISSLTLQYNRARQGAVTQELTEIVSGAKALE